jgi:hypothetical protein
MVNVTSVSHRAGIEQRVFLDDRLYRIILDAGRQILWDTVYALGQALRAPSAKHGVEFGIHAEVDGKWWELAFRADFPLPGTILVTPRQADFSVATAPPAW